VVTDTNVILRYLVRDGGKLAEQAIQYVEQAKDILVTDVVLMECVYVLLGQYNKTREQVCQALTMFLARENVQYVEGIAADYLALYAAETLDLADCYLIVYAKKYRLPLKTFDKKMQRVYKAEVANTAEAHAGF
jgi:predicted nucleic-acid-binding protein